MGEGSAIALKANQFDVASKRIVNTDPGLFGRVFRIDVPEETHPGATELNLAKIHADRRNADLVLTGHDRIVHLEFQHRADPAMADIASFFEPPRQASISTTSASLPD